TRTAGRSWHRMRSSPGPTTRSWRSVSRAPSCGSATMNNRKYFAGLACEAAEFERRTGASILQFYGSNEAGPLSVTRTVDPAEKRFATVGRPIPAQRVRLFDDRGDDETLGERVCAVIVTRDGSEL